MTEETYDKIMSMVASSPYHCVWDEESVDNHIHTPMVLGQFVTGADDDEGLFFFATFAFPEESHVQEYFRTNTFPVEGYYANGKDIWIIDFICLGGVRDIATSFRCLKNLICSMGYEQCFWLRTEKNKIGFHALKE
jgi:hemolysin-activating ACP:hemolysin acyltransferase